MGSKNLTIMLTDIKGFTEKTSGETRRGMSKLLADHDRLLIPVFHYFQGHIVKTIGDAFLVYFDSPTDAVLCGVTIQEVLRQHNNNQEEKDKLEVRVAINVGDVTVTSNDIMGEAVNIAARLEAVTDSGEVFFTEAVYQTMNRHEAPSSEIGERTFKGIPYSIRIYKVINDPGSDLAVTLAKGVKLSDKGPIIEGIRDQLASRQDMMLKKVLGGLALLVMAIAIWLTLVPSTVEKATSQADKLLEDGQSLAVITLMEPLLAEDPTNKILQAKAIEAAMNHIDNLERENRHEEAWIWLKETVLKKPYMAKINEKRPQIDTKITINKLLAEGDNGYQKPKEIRDLLTRYPDSFEVPYIAATMLEENKWWSMTVLWLYKTALERGGYHGDEKIYNFCTSRLEGGDINWYKFEYAVEILNKYYPEKLQEWAISGITSPNATIITLNALNILKNKKDPLLDDPYFDHLRNLVYGRNTDLEKDFTTFRTQNDPTRRQQLLALHREIIETFPRFTSYGTVRDTLKVNLAKLEKEWGIAK